MCCADIYVELLPFVGNGVGEITFIDGGCARALTVGVEVAL